MMKIEIWSDVMCPFCYIGKRRFEKAFNKFAHKNEIEVIWKSFQLNPDLVSDPTINALDHLAQSKGWTKEYTEQATAHVINTAKEEGLTFNYGKTIVANSLRAHALLHLAKEFDKQNEVKELLLSGYFIEGKNTDDIAYLVGTGESVGIKKEKILNAINSEDYHFEVKRDIQEGQQLGLTGVPFFVFDRKFGISGAQPLEVFENTLEQAYNKWEGNSTTVN